MTTDAAMGAASTPSGASLGSAPVAVSSTGTVPGAVSSAASAADAPSGTLPANPGVMGPVSASHTHFDSAPALPVSNGTASSVVIGSAVPSMGAGAMLQAVFGLAVVIALVFACGWVARRLGLKPSMRRGGIVKVVGSAALGARERVVVVEVRDTWLVLGVAAGNVRRLHTLPAVEPRLHDSDGTDFGEAQESIDDVASGEAARRQGTAASPSKDAADTRDLPNFQTAFARQLKDRLHGFGRSGNPGGKD